MTQGSIPGRETEIRQADQRGQKKSKAEQHFVPRENDMKFKFQYIKIKFYGTQIAVSICFLAAYGYLSL